MKKTIVAISTPLGKGAISIVRLSGENAIEIAQKFFMPIGKQKIEHRKMVLGWFDLGEAKEKCMMVYFKSPNSFTGEDVVEFQIHGGTTLTRLIQAKLIEGGARLAENGEFSKRAFENGKMSLAEAESIVDEINSESEAELKASLKAASGELFKEIKSIQQDLTTLLAQIEVTMDYPEEDENEVVREDVFNKMTEIKKRLNDILLLSKQKALIKKGINVAIIGKTNVGKSSLLNAIIGENKAIVTDIEGTTRDVVDASIDYNGVRFNFYDTAGIRESQDEVEKIGIEKSKKTAQTADITLLVLDGSENIKEEDERTKKLIKQPYIIVVNKTDKKRVLEKQQNEIEVSAKNKTNIEKLKKEIFEKTIKEEINFNGLATTNERQIEALNEAFNQVEEFFKEKDESLEILSLLIKKVWQSLGKITGETENEDIISLIFSKFCVGK